MNDKKQIDLRKNICVDTVTISGNYIQITTDNTTTVVNLKDKGFANIKEIVINGTKFYKISGDSVALTKQEYSDYLILQKNHEFIREKAKKLQADNERLYKNIGKFKEIVRKQASIEFSEKVKTKIKELRRKYHEDCINGLGDEEYNGITESDIDEILKGMGVE